MAEKPRLHAQEALQAPEKAPGVPLEPSGPAFYGFDARPGTLPRFHVRETTEILRFFGARAVFFTYFLRIC
jgi:hypothetical protein